MRKKNVFVPVLSVLLAFVMAVLPPVQAAAEGSQGKYISEVRIGVGKTADEAAASLQGCTILKDGNTNIDLNQGAGGGIGSKGERVVYLGYKTTDEKAEAVTDLAVMNMKGGYSVKDYEVLMEQQMTEQIIPFVEKFIATLEEYRENYTSDFAENKARAQYVHDALNRLTDDDCGGAGLGDLLLNETKYEMGDAAYDALSDEEKNSHADILTILAQANGQATLMMESLLTRGADTNEDTWVERFTQTSYDDLLALYGDMLPSDAAKELAKAYDDDAREILYMWNALQEQLESCDEKAEQFDELSAMDLTEQAEIVDAYDPNTATEDEDEAYFDAFAQITVVTDTAAAMVADLTLREYLSTIDYQDGTLADFFMQDYQTVADDITVLYPLVASLSEGQRAGLQFVTLSDLLMISLTDSEGYGDAQTDDTDAASIYEGVDRGIYQQGGVALTSEALRAHSAEEVAADGGKLSVLSMAMLGAAAVSVAAFGASAVGRISANYSFRWKMANSSLQKARKSLRLLRDNADDYTDKAYKTKELSLSRKIQRLNRDLSPANENGLAERCEARAPICNKLMLGFGIAMVVLSAAALYLSYRDLVAYYNVDYTPIPRYMVDEADITAYNAKGEKIVLKNQAAYYKAVECNRQENDEWFDILGTSGDLNGTVGRQWLALYTARNENMAPILASSLKAVVGSADVPADYTTGIHMFGTGAAFNLNNTQLVWNNQAKSVFVYFSVEEDAAEGSAVSASVITTGHLALAGAAGLLVGALGAVCVTAVMKKKKVK